MTQEFRPVLRKDDFVARYAAGEFGNASPTWRTLAEFLEAQRLGTVQGPMHLRNQIAGAPTWYNVPVCMVEHRFNELIKQGVSPADIYFSEMAPHHLNLIQGEVMQAEPGGYGLYLFYSRAVHLPMRDALRLAPEQAEGVWAVMLLKYFMCPNSWEWLNELLDRYPHHVVEFSTFGRRWGTLPNFNTVWWEVRKY